ncbi:MAG TPA: hypothetical protein DCM87_11045 [Planctomycetes bacterium]|nr:hypothetical protein [Planctomycetota bacterium]
MRRGAAHAAAAVIIAAAAAGGFEGSAPDRAAQAAVVTRLRYRIDLSEVPAGERDACVERTRAVLAQRLARSGLEGIELVAAGGDVRVTVSSGADDTLRRVEGLLGAQGVLEFAIVAEDAPNEARVKEIREREAAYRTALRAWIAEPAKDKEAAEPKPVPPAEVARPEHARDAATREITVDPATGKPVVARWLILHNTPGKRIAPARVAEAKRSIDPNTLTPAVYFTLDAQGAGDMARLTEAHIGAMLAIVVDGAVLTAPRIRARLAEGDGLITGNFTVAEASGLAAALSGGSLTAPLVFVAREGPLPVLPAPVTVLVFRHGEAYGNLRDASKYRPEQLDTLTENGVAQAKAAAAQFAGRDVAVILHSPAGRAKQTAALLDAQLHAAGGLVETSALASMRDGKTPEGKNAGFQWRLAHWARGEDPTPEGGESLGDAVARAAAQIESAAAAHAGKTIVVVSHSDICAGLAAYALGTPMCQAYASHHPGNAECFTMTVARTRTWTCAKP